LWAIVFYGQNGRQDPGALIPQRLRDMKRWDPFLASNIVRFNSIVYCSP